MSDVILNGSFETGTFADWITSNANVTNMFSHTGVYSARLAGGNVTSYIAQVVPVTAGSTFELFVSLAKVGMGTSAPVQLQVNYFNTLSIELGNALFIDIPVDKLPTGNEKTWSTVYHFVTAAPMTATHAFVLINSLPLAGTVDVLIDDVMLVTSSTGTSGVTGPT
ncbi:collagen-like protein, partial [Bacillus thuringiensis]